MNLLITLTTLAMVCIQKALAQTVTASLYALAWKPNANITRFESTVVVPPTTNVDSSKAIQQIWPGIGPVDGSAILLNSVSNQAGTGTWNLVPAYLPNGALPGQTKIFPGQAMTSLFTVDITNGQWLDAWVVESGAAPNVQSYVGSVPFNPATTQQNKAYQQAILAVELQEAATWSFGAISWQNVIIVAHTTSNSWCTSPTTSLGNAFKSFTYSKPVATVDGDYTTCYINSITMYGPN